MSTRHATLLSGLLLLTATSLFGQQQRWRMATTYFDQGEQEYNRSNWATATAYFDSCLFLIPDHFDALYSRALSREKIGDLEGAINDYGAMIHSRPEFTEAWWSRAQLRYQMGRYDQAYEDFYALLSLPEDETNAIFFRERYPDGGVSGVSTLETMRAEVFNYLGLTTDKLEKWDISISHFDDAIALNPDRTDYYINRSQAFEQKGDLTSAEIDLERAISKDPTNTLAKYNLARIQEENASGQKLVTTYDAIIKDQPGFSEAFAKRGLAKMQIGDLHGALIDYDSAIFYKSDDPLLWLNRGIIRTRLTDLPGAFSDLSKALDLRPDLDQAYLNRGNVLMKMERFNEAILDYDRALLYYPEMASAYYNRGIAHYNTLEKDLACKDIRRALELGMDQAKSTLDRMCN